MTESLAPLELITTSSVPAFDRASPTHDAGFTRIFDQLGDVNSSIQKAEQQAQTLVSGNLDNLHQVMASINRAKLNFDLAVQVRNKMLEGYQEIMRTQL